MKHDLGSLRRLHRTASGVMTALYVPLELSLDPQSQELDVVLRIRRMRSFWHFERSTGWVAEVCKLKVVAKKRPDRPTKTWYEVLVNDRKKLGMNFADAKNCCK